MERAAQAALSFSGIPMRLVFLLLLSSCATIPTEVMERLRADGLPGRWVTVPSPDAKSAGEESRVEISCDGWLAYQIRDEQAFQLRRAADQGQITFFEEGLMGFASWNGSKWTDPYQAPVRGADGCWRWTYKDREFLGLAPAECAGKVHRDVRAGHCLPAQKKRTTVRP